jgi:hypothetical protein
MQQQMRVPIFNDYPLPAQQAAAAAQHPMLAPRPVDVPATGHQAMPSETSPPERAPPAAAPQFYYPTPPVQIPPPSWPVQAIEEDRRGSEPQEPTDYSRSQPQPQPQSRSQSRSQSLSQSQSQSQSGSESQPINLTENHVRYDEQKLPVHYIQPSLNWENFPTSQDYAAQYASQLASESQTNKSNENPLFPLVCLYLPLAMSLNTYANRGYSPSNNRLRYINISTRSSRDN